MGESESGMMVVNPVVMLSLQPMSVLYFQHGHT